jgi:integrase
VIQVLTDHRERQVKERANTQHWQEGLYVFTSRRDAARTADAHPDLSRPVCERHGSRRVRLHDLRRARVSLLLALGVSPHVVMEIVGHSAIDMTLNVYSHVSPDTSAPRSTCSNVQLTEDAE